MKPEDEPTKTFWLGGDLSYVNEMEDCGGVYRENGSEIDPYELFAERGSDIIRIRIWHSPEWTNYSNYQDVEKSIRRAKENGMEVLLDFHYSDTWADPGRQCIPAAWSEVDNLTVLGDSLYNYTFDVLSRLAAKDLIPEFVQTGNEINSEILQHNCEGPVGQINWSRNSYLIGRALAAVKDISVKHDQPIQRMLHIAQPENAEWWFGQATQNGVTDYEYIGISYYSVWSDFSLEELTNSIRRLTSQYGKKLMVVETAYIYTLTNQDEANNILGQSSIVTGYPATPASQKAYMMALASRVASGGGSGVIYWEPGWISTGCSTQWGVGSHWDNATFFDAANANEALPVFDFLDRDNY